MLAERRVGDVWFMLAERRVGDVWFMPARLSYGDVRYMLAERRVGGVLTSGRRSQFQSSNRRQRLQQCLD